VAQQLLDSLEKTMPAFAQGASELRAGQEPSR
jgi:hypothetical protein